MNSGLIEFFKNLIVAVVTFLVFGWLLSKALDCVTDLVGVLKHGKDYFKLKHLKVYREKLNKLFNKACRQSCAKNAEFEKVAENIKTVDAEIGRLTTLFDNERLNKYKHRANRLNRRTSTYLESLKKG